MKVKDRGCMQELKKYYFAKCSGKNLHRGTSGTVEETRGVCGVGLLGNGRGNEQMTVRGS